MARKSRGPAAIKRAMSVVHGKGGAKSPKVVKGGSAMKPMRGAMKRGKMNTSKGTGAL